MLQAELDAADIAYGETPLDLRSVVNLDLRTFEEICRANPDLRLEQKRTGELVIVPPCGGESSDITSEVNRQLGNWVALKRQFKIYDSNALYVLPDGSKMGPDVSLLSKSKWRTLTPQQRRGFMPAVPEFVVEVKSPWDRLPQIKAKMNDWMRNGVELGCLIHYDRRLALVYSGDTVEEHDLTRDLQGTGPIQGFILSVREIDEAVKE